MQVRTISACVHVIRHSVSSYIPPPFMRPSRTARRPQLYLRTLSPGFRLTGGGPAGRCRLLWDKVASAPRRDGPLEHAIVLLHRPALVGSHIIGPRSDVVDGFSDEWRSVISQPQEVSEEERCDEG